MIFLLFLDRISIFLRLLWYCKTGRLISIVSFSGNLGSYATFYLIFKLFSLMLLMLISRLLFSYWSFCFYWTSLLRKYDSLINSFSWDFCYSVFCLLSYQERFLIIDYREFISNFCLPLKSTLSYLSIREGSYFLATNYDFSFRILSSIILELVFWAYWCNYISTPFFSYSSELIWL